MKCCGQTGFIYISHFYQSICVRCSFSFFVRSSPLFCRVVQCIRRLTSCTIFIFVFGMRRACTRSTDQIAPSGPMQGRNKKIGKIHNLVARCACVARALLRCVIGAHITGVRERARCQRLFSHYNFAMTMIIKIHISAFDLIELQK